jgi:DNA-binding NtrC family response regulator
MRARPTIVLIEPAREVRETKVRILEREAYEVLGVASVTAASPLLARPGITLVLLDLPEDRTAWNTLDTIMSRYPLVPVIVMQAHGRVEDAVEAMRRGATDYLVKSLDPPQLLRSVRQAIRSKTTTDSPPAAGLIEHSAAMHGLMNQVRRVASSTSNILLCGESGVGKEVVARYIHGVSPRGNREFVPINCASLAEEILENELFGHERGAFTGANDRKPGVFELADGGTLFLDEVDEIGLRCQAKLLRAIERKEFRRVGGTRKIQVDVRILAATNTDLQQAVAAHRFREDLYYRLNVVNLRIPPLRERAEVIPEMIEQFLVEFSKRTARRVRRVSPEAITKLVGYEWPGNVRELRNVIESLVLTVPGTRIEVADLPPTIRETTPRCELRIPVGLPLSDIEQRVFRAYVDTYGSKKEAAKALQVPLRTFHARAKRLGLRSPRETLAGGGAAPAVSLLDEESRVQIQHSEKQPSNG